jgi:hypothetical protein
MSSIWVMIPIERFFSRDVIPRFVYEFRFLTVRGCEHPDSKTATANAATPSVPVMLRFISFISLFLSFDFVLIWISVTPHAVDLIYPLPSVFLPNA